MSDEPFGISEPLSLGKESNKALYSGSDIPGENITYYRQPGGCIEASDQTDEEVDILHFCNLADARTFLAEFAAFVDAAEQYEPYPGRYTDERKTDGNTDAD